MAVKKLPAQEYLSSLFDYKEGALYWRIRKAYKTKVGDLVGHVNNHGYRTVIIDGKTYRCSRIVWKMVNGVEPIGDIDHIDGNRDNNSIENLRDIKKALNSRNRKTPKTNKSGVIGVSWNKNLKKWHAQCYLNKKRKHLGFFKVLEEAKRAREIFERENNYHKNHGRA